MTKKKKSILSDQRFIVLLVIIVDLQGNSTVLELLHKNNSIGGLILCYINE